MAVLVYCSTADATTALNNCAGLTPDGADKSKDGDKSNIELCDGRVDH